MAPALPPPTLRHARAVLYDVFSAFPVPAPLDGCPCCVKEEESAFLTSHPLESLLEGDLELYMRKAITTWGTEDDFRYFLPRLLELANGGLTWELGLMRSKLDYGGWEQWSPPMQTAVNDYLLAWWWDVEVGGQSSGGAACVALPEFLDFGVPLETLLAAWELPPVLEEEDSLPLRSRALALAHLFEIEGWQSAQDASSSFSGRDGGQFAVWLLDERALELLRWASAGSGLAQDEKVRLCEAITSIERWRG